MQWVKTGEVYDLLAAPFYGLRGFIKSILTLYIGNVTK